MKRICVIGAGAAGLCAARHTLAKHWEVVVFEKTGQLGGTWFYDERPSNGRPTHSSMYKNLMTNLPKEVMNFPGFPFNESLPSFMSHEVVLEYLHLYARNYDIVPYIKFNQEVENVEPINGEKEWKVTTKSTRVPYFSESQNFDAVFVCSGHYSKPNIPTIAGQSDFAGTQLHSHDYKEPKPYAGQRVAILGAGPSGTDIAMEIAGYADYVYLCHGLKPYISALPLNLIQKPSICGFKEKSIILTNGECIEVDTVLYCTGFQYAFNFFNSDFHLDVTPRRVSPMYMHLLHPDHPTVFFIGLCFVICPFPHFDVQVRYALSVIGGETKVPSKNEMNEWIKKDYQYRIDNVDSKQLHYLGPRQWSYMKELASLASIQTNVPDVFEKIYTFVHAFRLNNLKNYRSLNIKIIDNETFTYSI